MARSVLWGQVADAAGGQSRQLQPDGGEHLCAELPGQVSVKFGVKFGGCELWSQLLCQG
jgi:hypothetical protein